MARPVLKHFLRDNDQIDIGRQRLVYLSDNEAKVDPLPPDVLRHQMLGLEDRVVTAGKKVGVGKAAGGGRRRTEDEQDGPLIADLDKQVEASERAGGDAIAADSAVSVMEAKSDDGAALTSATKNSGKNANAGSVTSAAAESVAPRKPAPVDRAKTLATGKSPDHAVHAGSHEALPVRAAARAAAATIDTEAPRKLGSATAGAVAGPCVRVLSGASTGRLVPLATDQLSLGRVGVQVAVIRKVADGYRLIPLEGPDAPSLNGDPVAPAGAALRPGDTFEVAGVRLAFVASP